MGRTVTTVYLYCSVICVCVCGPFATTAAHGRHPVALAIKCYDGRQMWHKQWTEV